MGVGRKIKKAIREPHLAFRELNRLYHHHRNGADYNTSGVDIFERDWDNLLLLDACRYDMFDEISTVEGDLTSVESRGADTLEFLRGNFRDRELHDTVYVTASPMLHRHKNSINTEFHDIIDIWNQGDWDEDLNTVPAEPVNSKALSATNEYPNKRLLIHYLQPHYPFIGSNNRPFSAEEAFINDGPGSWTHVANGELQVNKNEVWQSYRDNLEYVLDTIRDLLPDLEGKTVVTSDHGNLLGERGSPIPISEWGHPRGLHVQNLVKVPWLEIPSDIRKEITAEAPEGKRHHQDTDASKVQDRLAHLGYIDKR